MFLRVLCVDIFMSSWTFIGVFPANIGVWCCYNTLYVKIRVDIYFREMLIGVFGVLVKDTEKKIIY